ncbi:DUF5718 family protein [Vibrio nitrifigilis]|uniref:Uncharacterized protein n=1 Tax=Vibrio nitrifigilis TaxID=2789781 RepID=A0ABS0GLW9_9VIBR|nr:DUF5718 family protein [Vibrio nitrifigilis]MBF9003464.1 hypothetical protein [Vibrio nitrifigilis]
MSSITIGVIGNYFGHLSSAENVHESEIPSGIFIIDQNASSLTNGDATHYPERGSKVDIEPEFVIRYTIEYTDNKVSKLIPLQLTVGNDVTIRSLEGATKISSRKSWGQASKGIHPTWWSINQIDNLNNLSLVSYIERDGEAHLTTQPLRIEEMKLFGQALDTWMVEAINGQQEHGMFDEILPTLAAQGYPEELILYTGAPNYTTWGTENFLQPGDSMHIIGYKTDNFSDEQIDNLFKENKLVGLTNVLYLKQQMVEPALVD